MSLKSSLPSGLIVAACSLAVAGCDPQAAPKPPAQTSVEIAELRSPSGIDSIRATGTVSRSREAALSFRIPGIMSGLTVDVGDRVTAGQQVAILDAPDAAARLKQSSAELAQAERDARRLDGLVEAGAISRQQYDAARTRAVGARAAYQAAAFDSRSARLVSPVSGVVLSRTAQRGEVVQPSQTIITVADFSSPLILRLPVADRDVSRIKMGSPAIIQADALGPGQIRGRVTRVGQQAGSQDGAVVVEVTLPSSSGLMSGMVATARISTTPVQGAAAYARIPAEAILEANNGRAFVMRYDKSRQVARRTAVTFGGFDGDDALVGGLSQGAQIITGGAGYVADGDRVTTNASTPR